MSCSILTSPKATTIDGSHRFNEQSISDKEIDEIPARNQVTVFGYAVDEHPALLPLPIYLANRLTRQLTQVRKTAILPYLMPDAKIQVGVEYNRQIPHRIHSITLEVHTRRLGKPSRPTLLKDFMETVVQPVFKNLSVVPDEQTAVNINPNGVYLGGPSHHSGLTGRKMAVDTYGEYTRHSGKALSGKDPLRVDRTGAYAARYAAKNIVASGLANRCEVLVSYATGLARPVSIMVNTFGSGCRSDQKLTDLVRDRFEFRPAGILQSFQLRHLPARRPNGFFRQLSAYGHFGREELDLPWEKTDMVDRLQIE
jgi:S-adenosylmethionine synthetase